MRLTNNKATLPAATKAQVSARAVSKKNATTRGAAHALLRASEVDHGAGTKSPLALTLAWVREFLARSHPDLGRSGPVCPFTPIALGLDTIWFTEVADADPNPKRIVEIIGAYRDQFLAMEPRSGSEAVNKSILIVFAHLNANGAAIIEAVQAELKPSFVELGLMLGEFHSANQSPGLRNPEFRPLRSPLPMLAIRHMVESDLPFLRRASDAPHLRVSYLRSYLRRLGTTTSRNNFDQAIDSLVEAQIQLRAQTGAAGVAGSACPAQAARPGGKRVAGNATR